MKTLIIVFLLAGLSFSQHHNPDGEKVSIHLTPFFSMFKANNSLGFLSTSDPKINFNVMLKIPASENVTYSLFFQRDSYNYDFAFDPQEVLFNQKFTFTRFGMTISYYFK